MFAPNTLNSVHQGWRIDRDALRNPIAIKPPGHALPWRPLRKLPKRQLLDCDAPRPGHGTLRQLQFQDAVFVLRNDGLFIDILCQRE